VNGHIYADSQHRSHLTPRVSSALPAW